MKLRSDKCTKPHKRGGESARAFESGSDGIMNRQFDSQCGRNKHVQCRSPLSQSYNYRKGCTKQRAGLKLYQLMVEHDCARDKTERRPAIQS